MIQKINELFGGDVNDIRPLHANSMCRIAVVGYLNSVGFKTKSISRITGWKYGTVRDRLHNHRCLVKFNPEYKNKFKCLETIKSTYQKEQTTFLQTRE